MSEPTVTNLPVVPVVATPKKTPRKPFRPGNKLGELGIGISKKDLKAAARQAISFKEGVSLIRVIKAKGLAGDIKAATEGVRLRFGAVVDQINVTTGNSADAEENERLRRRHLRRMALASPEQRAAIAAIVDDCEAKLLALEGDSNVQ